MCYKTSADRSRAHDDSGERLVYWEVGAARDLDQDTLDRRRVLGEDHPLTLASAYHLAADLRELREVGDTSDRDASGRMAFDITEDDRSGDLPESPGVALFLVGLTACRISDSEAALTGPSWRATCSEADEAPVSVRARPVPSALGRLERRCATVAVDKPRTSGLIRWPAASAGPACAGRAFKAEPGAAPGRGGAQRSRLDNHYN